ncbi:hypothetical protein [Rickettsia endosymbiont of Orchestes rusci]|uniref:hypothetical protein n=1 Tax=Rickettsia endosymbiont of Orchestes rusci TaxID=3066250 RepID=UPI00313F0471
MHGSKKVPYVILAKGGNPEKNSHSEFISESTKKDAQNLFSMTKLESLDSRLRGNDTEGVFNHPCNKPGQATR